VSGSEGTGAGCIRDMLALRRTSLANERTLLAYIRTALALGAAGVTVIRLLKGETWQVTGWILAAAGALLLGIGLLRFISVRRCLSGEVRTGGKPQE
jgi:putative membrane protein